MRWDNINDTMPSVDHLRVFCQFPSDPSSALIISYVPLIDGSLSLSHFSQIDARRYVRDNMAEGYDNLVGQARLLADFLSTKGIEEIKIRGVPTNVSRPLTRVLLDSGEDRPIVYYDFDAPGATPWPGPESFTNYLSGANSGRRLHRILGHESLPPGQQRLVDSMVNIVSSLAWDDLQTKWGATPRPSRQIFISYRSTHEEVARAIAERLGNEGFVPWFDRWEILAGDSVPGKIESGLRESMAFVPIITRDYQQGKWATEELETAVHRRIEEGFSIVPIVLEACERPELIRHLRYVDFSDGDPQKFESRVGEIIDGINRLAKNPFR